MQLSLSLRTKNLCISGFPGNDLAPMKNCPGVHQKVQVGKDQEKAQSEKDSHSKNRGGKKPNQQSGTYTMKHIVSRMSSYFPNRWPLSYLNLTKNMKTYIRRQQHKKFFKVAPGVFMLRAFLKKNVCPTYARTTVRLDKAISFNPST